MTLAVRKSLRYIHDDCEYYPHQIEGIRKLARWGSFILADEPGLGKSLQALTVFAIDVERGTANHALVVCPTTLKDNWAIEIQKHTHFQATVLEGTPVQRDKIIDDFLDSGDHILIVNYEQVWGHIRQLNEIGFDVVIYDEAHSMKNPKAKRTKACHGLRAPRHFCLTGTPMMNQINELWSLLHRVAPAEFPNYYQFLNRYAVFGGYKDKQIVGIKNEKELRERLQSLMLRRTKSEVLDLPEKQYIQVWCGMHPDQQKLYKEVKEELTLSSPAYPSPVEIENALHKFGLLKRICGSSGTVEGYADHSAKLDRAIEVVMELFQNDHKVVVFTADRKVHKFFAERLMRAGGGQPFMLSGDTPQNQRALTVQAWEDHPLPSAMLCMIQVGGVGLNMTAARHVVMLDKSFVPAINDQAIDRCHRIGADTTQPVQIYEMLCRGTIEERVEKLIKKKRKLFDVVVETSDFKKKLYAALTEEDDD